jgi:hypothetical protein
MSLRAVGLGICLACLLVGCAPKRQDLAAFYAHPPRSIVVVPVVNDSTEVSAPSVFITTVTAPLAERGYYVFPVYLTDLLLRDLGLSEAGHVHLLPAERFFELFGADAVLLISIKDWSTKYLLLVSSVEVDIEYVLKDTRTGTPLWAARRRVVQSSGGGGNPIAMLVAAAVHALFTDYLPLARQANGMAFVPPDGLPAGPYHPDYQRDRARFQ